VRAPTRAIKLRAERMLAALVLTDRELSIVLCDDATIRALNARYRRKDAATDVLAFAMEEGRAMPETALLGDLVVSLDTAARQADARGARVLDEVTMLVAHGLLHLLGFDHRNRKEERRMKARTDMLVAVAIGPRDGRGGRGPCG